MKHTYRFYATKNNLLWSVTGDEFVHLKKVLRLKAGDEVEVFDGKGYWSKGEISNVSSKEAQVACEEVFFEKELTPRFSIAIGALKPAVFDQMLPSLIELGVFSVHVFLQPQNEKFRANDKARERWRRIALAAAKQCKRVWLPDIFVWESLKNFTLSEQFKSYDSVYVLQPGDYKTLLQQDLSSSKRIMAIVGGEKGLIETEIDELKPLSNVHFVKLGHHILRAYTAAITAASLLSLQQKTE